MNNLRRWLGRRIGRRNMPFLAAVLLLTIAIILLLVLSPSTDSGNHRRDPTLVATD